MMTTLTQQEKTILIDGPTGKLEVSVSVPSYNKEKRQIFAVVCHPHPLYGGTMHNKVVTTLVKALQTCEVIAVRFNFRGVGKSEGHYGEGEGELEDLLTVLAYMQSDYPTYEVWLAGFSFGAYIAAKAATKVPVTKLITVAPAVLHFPMDTLPAITCPWLLLQGDLDDVVPAKNVLEWAMTRDPQPTIERFPSAGHFFHGELAALREKVERWLNC